MISIEFTYSSLYSADRVWLINGTADHATVEPAELNNIAFFFLYNHSGLNYYQ